LATIISHSIRTEKNQHRSKNNRKGLKKKQKTNARHKRRPTTYLELKTAPIKRKVPSNSEKETQLGRMRRTVAGTSSGQELYQSCSRNEAANKGPNGYVLGGRREKSRRRGRLENKFGDSQSNHPARAMKTGREGPYQRYLQEATPAPRQKKASGDPTIGHR